MAGLQRNLGLSAVFTVSLGAMIGSGIFVLPGLATKLAGPGAALAYFLAGLIVIPAGLSQSEMATAMPRAGGAYLFIDRAMGPLMGTVAGFGVWFALVFKAAFALVGLGGYLVYFLDVPIKIVGVTLALLLVMINAYGVKQSGGFQTVVVFGVLAVLGYFVIVGGTNVNASAFDPFLTDGLSGLLAATGLVFVSYAGVTNIASVAEEVKDPGRTLPRGMLWSIGLMIFLYPAMVWVIVGNVPLAGLAGDPRPIATAAEQFMGRFGVGVISAAAVLALVSMANAGLLSSSRYPFAMARNSLAPSAFARINAKTGTPIVSIALTGAMMLLLIAFVPLFELAKLASAFQALVFTLINLSLIAFRESNASWYQPSFRSPFYPWTQIFGIIASMLLLSQLGVVSIVGSIAIVVGGVLWYRGFGRSRASHESAALDALRLRSIGSLVAMTSDTIRSPGRDHIVILVSARTSNQRLRDLLRLAKAMRADDGRITLARMDRERHGALWWRQDTLPRPDDPFRLGAKDIADDLGLDIAIIRPRGSDSRHALIDYANRHAVDLILGESLTTEQRSLGTPDVIWIQEHAESDVMYLGNKGLHELTTITVLGAGSPFDVAKIDLATRLAHHESAHIDLMHVLGEDATEAQAMVIAEYHQQLIALSPARMHSVIDHSRDLISTIRKRATTSDLIVMGASRTGIGTELSERISTMVNAPVLIVHAPDRGETPLAQRLLQRLIY